MMKRFEFWSSKSGFGGGGGINVDAVGDCC